MSGPGLLAVRPAQHAELDALPRHRRAHLDCVPQQHLGRVAPDRTVTFELATARTPQSDAAATALGESASLAPFSIRAFVFSGVRL